MKGMKKEFIKGTKFWSFCASCKLYAYTAGDARRHAMRIHKKTAEEVMNSWPEKEKEVVPA